MWMFDKAKKAWHLWDGLPLRGEVALCGLPKTDIITQEGDGISSKRCEQCSAERAKQAPGSK